jgi:hypothetical protein
MSRFGNLSRQILRVESRSRKAGPRPEASLAWRSENRRPSISSDSPITGGSHARTRWWSSARQRRVDLPGRSSGLLSGASGTDTCQSRTSNGTSPRTAGAFLVPRHYRKRNGHQRVSRYSEEDLASLAARSVAAAMVDVSPFLPPQQALSAPTTVGRRLDRPSRSEPMRLRSRMREFCTPRSVGGPGG